MAKLPSDKPRRRLRATPATDFALRGDDLASSRQGPLFADPMPERIEACLAFLADKAPATPHGAFDMKWDGDWVHVQIEPLLQQPPAPVAVGLSPRLRRQDDGLESLQRAILLQ